MTLIITMAGHGKRFTDAGYLGPKHRIMARGQPLFYWSMLSLVNFFEQHFIFACLKDDDIDWIKQVAMFVGIKKISIYLLDEVSNGQAETAYFAARLASLNEPVWIYDIDTYVADSAMMPQDIGISAGCIPVIKSTSPLMSYVKYDSHGKVIHVVEKSVISEWATVGLFGFRNTQEFLQTYQQAYIKKEVALTNGEQYVAPIYQVMIRQNKLITTPRVSNSDFYSLGTPEELLEFDPQLKPPYGH